MKLGYGLGPTAGQGSSESSAHSPGTFLIARGVASAHNLWELGILWVNRAELWSPTKHMAGNTEEGIQARPCGEVFGYLLGGIQYSWKDSGQKCWVEGLSWWHKLGSRTSQGGRVFAVLSREARCLVAKEHLCWNFICRANKAKFLKSSFFLPRWLQQPWQKGVCVWRWVAFSIWASPSFLGLCPLVTLPKLNCTSCFCQALN